MLVDDPKDYEELHEMVLDQELCIHITEDMLTMSPDQNNGFSGTSLCLAQSPTVDCSFVSRDENVPLSFLLGRTDRQRCQLLHLQLLRDRGQDERTEHRVSATGTPRTRPVRFNPSKVLEPVGLNPPLLPQLISLNGKGTTNLRSFSSQFPPTILFLVHFFC